MGGKFTAIAMDKGGTGETKGREKRFWFSIWLSNKRSEKKVLKHRLCAGAVFLGVLLLHFHGFSCWCSPSF
jgi:hypothetical protein